MKPREPGARDDTEAGTEEVAIRIAATLVASGESPITCLAALGFVCTFVIFNCDDPRAMAEDFCQRLRRCIEIGVRQEQSKGAPS